MRVLMIAALMAAAPAAAQPRLDQPQSIWKPSADGAVEHLQSGLRCPSRLGEFERGGAVVYDGFGMDVSCGYDGKGATITLYLTRLPGIEVENSFVGAKEAVPQNPGLRGAKLVAEGRGDQAGLAWRRAEFAQDNGLRSDVWVADLNGWVLKYRASYQPAAAPAVAAELERLTQLVQASAGQQTALCAKSRSPERLGRPARGRRNSQEVGLMGALLGGVAAAGAQERGEAPPIPVTYCVEGPTSGKTPMLAWHGVLPDGSDADADRLTVMTVGPPPILDSTADELGSLVMAEIEKRDARPRWMASMQSGSQTTIFGYYDGRPSMEMLAALFKKVLDGKAKSLGSYGVDGTTVTIGIPSRR